MPSIKIREIDTISPGTLENITNVVYVPGFINPSYINEDGTSSCIDAFVPTLCTSITEFETNFGSVPASFVEDQYYSSLDGFAVNAVPTNDDVMFSAGTMDLGYVYAKELLTAGLPVLYERINTDSEGADINIEYLYSVLNESNDTSIWENLKDLNEYDELKFLTSGGYPTFEYSDSKLAISGKDLDTSLVSLDSEKFKAAIKVLGLDEDMTKSYTFKYADRLKNAIYYESREALYEAYSFVKPSGTEEFYITDEKVLLVPSYVLENELIPQAVLLEDGSALEDDIILEGTESGEEEVEETPSEDTESGEEETNRLIFNGYVEVPENEWKVWTPAFIPEELLFIKDEDLFKEQYENSVGKQRELLKKQRELLKEPLDIKKFGITIGIYDENGELIKGATVFEGASITVTWPKTKGSSIVTKMLTCAADRNDCVALIDHTDCYDRSLNPNDIRSVYYSVSNPNSAYNIAANGEFGAMFTPWCGTSFASALINNYNRSYAVVPSTMPPSLFYLRAFAKQMSAEGGDWLAIAGSKRGQVNITKLNLISSLRMTSTIADAYQPRNAVSINAIANIKPFGYIIWGNRTLANNAVTGNLVATSFLNLRNIISSVKKTAFLAAKYCMFEQNSDILWLNYTNYISPILDELVSAAALNDYTLTRVATTEKAKLACKITLYPIYAVEAFDITVELADDELTVE